MKSVQVFEGDGVRHVHPIKQPEQLFAVGVTFSSDKYPCQIGWVGKQGSGWIAVDHPQWMPMEVALELVQAVRGSWGVSLWVWDGDDIATYPDKAWRNPVVRKAAGTQWHYP